MLLATNRASSFDLDNIYYNMFDNNNNNEYNINTRCKRISGFVVLQSCFIEIIITIIIILIGPAGNTIKQDVSIIT